MVTFNHIMHEPIGNSVSLLITTLGRVSTCKADEDDGDEVVAVSHQECHPYGSPSS